MNDPRERLRYKVHIAHHLTELGHLTNRLVLEGELLTPDRTRALREQMKTLPEFVHKFTIPFSERQSERFQAFIEQGQHTFPKPVYLWTQYTNECGALRLSSIRDLNFGFDFKVESNGILSLIAEDLTNRMLLDFYEDGQNQLLDIELAGTEWGKLAY